MVAGGSVKAAEIDLDRPPGCTSAASSPRTAPGRPHHAARRAGRAAGRRQRAVGRVRRGPRRHDRRAGAAGRRARCARCVPATARSAAARSVSRRTGASDAELPASLLYLGSEAEVRADATQRGAGGSLLFLSDDHLRLAGATTARGGTEGGDGGADPRRGRTACCRSTTCPTPPRVQPVARRARCGLSSLSCASRPPSAAARAGGSHLGARQRRPGVDRGRGRARHGRPPARRPGSARRRGRAAGRPAPRR